MFTAWTGPGLDERNVAVQSLGAAGHRVIVRGAETGRYVDGYLLYGRLDNLFAVPWKPGQDLGAVEPVELAQHVRGDSEGHAYAVSGTGTLAYLQGSPRRYENHVVWVDRNGRAEALQVSPGNFEVVSLAPDGDKAIVQRNGGLETLWMYDVSRGTLAPFLTPEGSSQSPVWTPDGQYIIYRGTRAGRRNMYRKRADGVGGEEPLTNEPGVTQTPGSVSSDGRWLVFAQSGGSGGSDLLALDLTAPAGSPARVVANLSAAEGSGRVSPDGRWIVYVSDKSGKSEIYVQAFPDPGPVYPVSTDGGREPLWSRDGREIYYVPLSGDGLMVANVTLTPFKATQPRVLFTGYYKPSIHQSAGYDVSVDGRFLRVQPTYAEGPITRVEVVLNWLAGLKAGGTGK